MTWLSFFGNFFLAYSPVLVILCGYIGQHALLLLLTISSMFMWLGAAFFASLFWYIIPPIRSWTPLTIFVAVGLEELFRWLYYLLIVRSEKGLSLVTRYPDSPINRVNYALVAGFGYSFMSSMVLYVTYLAQSASNGIIPCTSCPAVTMNYIAAWTCMIFSLLHIVWGLVGFEGYKLGPKSKAGVFRLCLVIIGHFAASYSTLFIPSTILYGCIWGNLIPLIILIGTAWVAWKDVDPTLSWKAPEGEDQRAQAEERQRERVQNRGWMSAEIRETPDNDLRRRTNAATEDAPEQ